MTATPEQVAEFEARAERLRAKADKSDPRKSGALMPTGLPQPFAVLTKRQRELVRLALYDYCGPDWVKGEVDEVLDLFRGIDSEVRVYR